MSDTTAEQATTTLSIGDTANEDASKNTSPASSATTIDTSSVSTEQPVNGADTTTINEQPTESVSDNWSTIRERVANGDEKLLKRLSRYSTLDEALRAGVEAQNKIGSLKPVQALTKDSTPEEIAAYRKANGIPETFDGYEINLPDGIVLGDNDKPIADAFLKIAHEHNLPPNAVNAIISSHLQLQEQAVQSQQEFDLNSQNEAQRQLKSSEVWGNEAKVNINLINDMFSNNAPPEVREMLEHARLPNGNLLGNDVPTLKFLASLAREVNPYATIAGASDDALSTIDAEMGELEKLMGDHKSDYWKGPTAEAKQKRYAQLIGLKNNIKSR